MKEQQIQKKISDYLERDGWFVIKLIRTNKNGIPDLIAINSERTVFFEVKTPTGKTSVIQEFRIKQLQRLGLGAYIVRSVEEVKKVLY